MLKLWGRMSSINVRKVVLCAQVLGLDIERIDAGLSYGVVNTPDYRAKNFNGLVPLLEDFSAPPAPIYALRPPGGVPSTAAVALVDHLAAALGTRPPS